MANETTMLESVCESASGAPDGWGLALALVREGWFALALMALLPLLVMLLVGWWTASLRKVNFWLVFFGVVIAELLGLLAFVIVMSA